MVPSALFKLCTCEGAHSFQRLRTCMHLLRTDILSNKHIVALGLLHNYSVANLGGGGDGGDASPPPV